MTQAEHEERIRKIEAETEEIKRQIMQLEFQHKKDIAAADNRREEWDEMITKKITHIAKLAGITYEELNMMEDKLVRAGGELSKPRDHATLS